jgi:hypothetical protein
VCEAALADRQLLGFAHELPAPVAELVRSRPAPTAWLPSVHVQALFLAIADAYEMSDRAFLEWSYRVQKPLYAGPIYRPLMVLASPRMLLGGAKLRWSSVHRGSDIDVRTINDASARVTVSYPQDLFAETNLHGFAGGFRAVVELSNARSVDVSVAYVGATHATFDVTWR